MALLQNIGRFSEYLVRQHGQNNSDNVSGWSFMLATHLNKYVGDAGLSQKHGVPKGYSSPYAWLNPVKGGGLSFKLKTGGTLSKAQLAKGLYATSTTSSSGNVALANLQMITNLAATCLGEGTLSKAQLVGVLGLSSTIIGSGEITLANLGAIMGLVSTVMGTSSVQANLIGLAILSAHVYVNQSQAEINQLVDAVWNAYASQYNLSGTMGEKVNDAGSASNPWTEIIEDGYSAAEILKFLTAVLVGKTSITDLGSNQAIVNFRNLTDTLNRVSAELDGSERTNITLNTD